MRRDISSQANESKKVTSGGPGEFKGVSVSAPHRALKSLKILESHTHTHK